MFDIAALIKAFGYFGVTGMVFAESGLLIGFFLPGDSLLFTAGFLASQGYLHITTLCILSFIAAVAGDSFGYAFGRKLGPKIFTKENSIFFHREHVARAQHFYEKHGAKTLILARFTPVIRTFAPILAGVGSMRYGKFLAYNVIGGFFWSVGLSLMGYFLGNAIPNIDRYMMPIILGIIFVSFIPSIVHVVRTPEDRRQTLAFLKNLLGMRS
jgi:membrane-associated protein